MAKFKLTSPTGESVIINAPEGATQQDAEKFIEAQLFGNTRRQNTVDLTPDYSDVNPLGLALGRGVDITQQFYGSALEGLGRVTGVEGLEKYGGDVAAQQEEELAETAPFTTRLKDVREAEGFLDTTGKLAAFGGTALGESLPQMGTTLAGSALGAAKGARMGSIFGLPGAATGAIIGGLAANIPFFYGGNREAQKEAIAEGKKIELNEGLSLIHI